MYSRTLATIILCLGFAAASGAATLSLATDKTTYLLGELIFVSVVGDTQGAADDKIVGRLRYSAPLGRVFGLSSTQSILESGAVPWFGTASQPCGVISCIAFSQIAPAGLGNPQTVDGPAPEFGNTMLLLAIGTGPVTLFWHPAGPTAFDFFGATPNSVAINIKAPIQVDIQPEQEPESLNKINVSNANKKIQVALLGSATFDVSVVDAATVTFGPAGAVDTHGLPHVEDANGDSFDDLLGHFRVGDTGIAVGDTTACMDALLLDATPVQGCDQITTAFPACGLGFEAALALAPIFWLRRRMRRA